MNVLVIKRVIVVSCMLLVVGSSSCKKFLSSYSQNKSFVETASDLDEVLVGEGYENTLWTSPNMLFVMDDDVTIGRPEASLVAIPTWGFYTWQPEPRVEYSGKPGNTDAFFNRMYLHISRLNTILYNVPLMRTKGEPASQLQRISGEAHFLRAFIYFMLVNVYGHPYSKASAQTDFGVPLKTEPPVDDKFFPRSTVKQVYDQVTADLLEAEKELETFNAGNPIRANLVAVQALLSRVYLYQEEYEKAILYADKVLAQPTYKLYDLNHYPAGADFNTKSSPETIFTMGRTAIPMLMYSFMDKPNAEFFRLSDELVTAYKPEDLRIDAFYSRNSEGILRCVKTHSITGTLQDVSDCWLLRIAEIYLNKAEALAMLGRDQDAINAVQQLRKARFRPADLTDVSDAGEALVNFIRHERRLELSFEAHRWFDLRRYAVNSKWPFSKTIRHDAISWNGAAFVQNGYYELKPYDQDQETYVIPIAMDEIEFNGGVLQNASRPARPLKN